MPCDGCLTLYWVDSLFLSQTLYHKNFLRVVGKITRIHKPYIGGLLEMKTKYTHADMVCNKLGFEHWIKVKAVGFSDGIWVLWKDIVQVEVLRTHP